MEQVLSGTIVWVREATLIVSIPLSIRNFGDYWKWMLERRRQNTVCSTYWKKREGAGPNNELGDVVWRRVWLAQAPPKMINLVWRAVANCLPTWFGLSSGLVPVPSICVVCVIVKWRLLFMLLSLVLLQREFGRWLVLDIAVLNLGLCKIG